MDVTVPQDKMPDRKRLQTFVERTCGRNLKDLRRSRTCRMLVSGRFYPVGFRQQERCGLSTRLLQQ